MKVMTIFIKGKMKETFSKHFTDKKAGWDYDEMTFDRNHSCSIKIQTETNFLCIASYKGDKETVIQHILDWFRTFRIPYIVSCEKILYTPFPETEYLLQYQKEIKQFFSPSIYGEKVLLFLNLEQNVIELYYGKREQKYKMVSLSKDNFDSWKEELQKEKNSIETFQNELQGHMKEYPISGIKKSTVHKKWNDKEETWEYVIFMHSVFREKKLSEKTCKKIIRFYNSLYATENIFHTLVKEIKKWDPYVCVRKNRKENRYDVFTCGKRFIFNTDYDNYRTKLTFMIGNYETELTKTSYLLQHGKEIEQCIKQLLKPFQILRMSTLMEDKTTTEHPVMLPLKVYFNYSYGSRFLLLDDENATEEAYEEIWDYLQQTSQNELQKEIIEIEPIEQNLFSTKNYTVSLHSFSKLLAIEKNENKSA